MPLTYPSKFEGAIDPATWNRARVDPRNPIEKDLNGFLAYRMAYYESSEFRDTQLWLYFREDFEDWTKDKWALGDRDIIRELRDFLRRNGVFVPTDGRSIAANIQKVLDDDNEHQWTPQEVQHQIKVYRRLDSRWNPADSPPLLLPFNSQQEMLAGTLSGTLPGGQTVLPAGGVPKLLTDLSKMYSDRESKFGGELYDILGSKLRIFYDLC